MKQNFDKAEYAVEKKKLEGLDIALLIILTILGLSVFIPFYTSIILSIATEKEYLTHPFLLFPHEVTFDAYRQLWSAGEILVGYKNTLYHILFGMPISMFMTFSLGYALSRPKFPGRRLLCVYVLITMLFSGGLVPNYLLIKSLGLMNSRWSVILLGGLSVFNCILMMNYIRTLPESLFESARLDGAREIVVLFRIVLPLSTPIIATVGLFELVGKWNEWYNSMLYINRSTLYPLQLVLRHIIGTAAAMENEIASAAAEMLVRKTFDMGVKMAAVVLTMLPVMCVYPFLQKYFLKGITIGAVKE